MRHVSWWLAVLVFGVQASVVAAQDQFFDSNGVKIRYVEQGSGEPLVLVHGRNESIESWIASDIFLKLAADYRVIAFDCRGHGKSGKPHDPKQYGQEMSLDIVRLLDHLGIRKAHIVGYSMGAQITSHLLTIRPDRFLSATLGGAGGRLQWTEKDDDVSQQQAAEVEKWGFSPTARELTTGVRPTEAEVTTRSTALLANPNQDRFAMAALIRSFRELVITPAQVAAIDVPTLGIAGSEDPYLLELQALKKIRPALQLVVIDGATHDGERGALRRTEFSAALRAFLAPRQETGFLNRVVTVASETYRYQVYVPANYSADKLWPIVLFLHGVGERGADGLMQTETGLGAAIRRNGAAFPAIVVFPQARLDHRWDDAMLAQGIAALEAATLEFHGDRDRTYLTGLSMGGRGAWSLASKDLARFAALAIIAGAVTSTPDNWTTSERETALQENEFLRSPNPYAALAMKVRTLPIWLFHGSADMTLPVTESRKMTEALQRLGADVKYTEYEGLPHNSWDRAYAEADLMPWLLAQRRQAKR